METVVGIGEYVVTNIRTDKIKTYALASCIAVTAYSPSKKVAGMIHVALPEPLETGDRKRAGYYATTGIPLLIDKLCNEFGCPKGELRIHIYGGAESISDNDVFKIGKRNIDAVSHTLSKLGLRAHYADVGGVHSRTIEMDVAEGNVKTYRQPMRI